MPTFNTTPYQTQSELKVIIATDATSLENQYTAYDAAVNSRTDGTWHIEVINAMYDVNIGHVLYIRAFNMQIKTENLIPQFQQSTDNTLT